MFIDPLKIRIDQMNKLGGRLHVCLVNCRAAASDLVYETISKFSRHKIISILVWNRESGSVDVHTYIFSYLAFRLGNRRKI